MAHLTNIPKELVANVVFDQSLFVKRAIETLLDEGGMGLILTALMVLMFLASVRATVAVFLSIPLSALAAFIALYFGGSSINTMILAGLALVFSRLIDNAVVVLENIFRHLEMGEPPAVAAEQGGQEVALAVLAATLTSSVVFFPVMFLYGVSRFLFSALALAVVLALFASYFVAMTVVPLFCAKLIKAAHHGTPRRRCGQPATRECRGASDSAAGSTGGSRASATRYERRVRSSLRRPGLVVRHHGRLSGEPRAVSVPRRGVLPPHRCGPVRDQRQVTVGQSHRGDRRTSRGWRRWSVASSSPRIWT